MDVNWGSILREALKAGTSVSAAAVPGAKLRLLVAEVARKQGVEFPPPDMKSFSGFLEQFKNDVIVQRRKGRDILVAPADAPELLISKDSDDGYRLREDIFKALTHIPTAKDNLAIYIPERGDILWFATGEAVPVGAIPLPTTTLEKEIEVRATFIKESELSTPVVETLTQSLKSSAPLRDFTNTIKSFGLARKWHEYRIARLVQWLRAWSNEHGISWQSSWIQESNTVRVTAALSKKGSAESIRALFTILEANISDADLSRISIPLDIVLRMLQSKD